MTSMAAKSKGRKNINTKSLKFSLRNSHTITNMSNDTLGNKTTQAVSHANKHKGNNSCLLLVFKQTMNISGLLVNFTLHPVSSQRSTDSVFNGFSKAEGLFNSPQKVVLRLFFPLKERIFQ